MKIAFSTCPNDTFMFDAMVNGRIETKGEDFEITMEDILHLNHRALNSEMDLVKISYNTFGKVMDQYQLLRAGSAMGKGCGPLLVARPGMTIEMLTRENGLIAIPGFNTTANLLLSFFNPSLSNKMEMLFHEVMPAVENGTAMAGLIIHENRFTYPAHGLISLLDLGEHWESKTGLPIPLGAIVARKSLGKETILRLQEMMKASVEYAFKNPDASKDFVRENAQEMDSAVCQSHIELYVNEYSLDIGKDGELAIQTLLEAGEKAGLLSGGRAKAFEAQLNFLK